MKPGNIACFTTFLLILEPSLKKNRSAIGTAKAIRYASTAEDVASAAFTKTGVMPHNKTARFTARTDNV
jgi:hypothetical protein